jgi:solute carrier family 25 carnitine/acylcarnitine transporter 20/29
LFSALTVATLQTLVNEGLKGIYKGISAPLATVALFNAVLFASRGQMEVLLQHKDGGALMLATVMASCPASSHTPGWCSCVDMLSCHNKQQQYETTPLVLC